MGGSDGKHWEGVLVPRNVILADALENDFKGSAPLPKLYAFGTDRSKYKELSINHWKMGIAAELLRSAAWEPDDYVAARGVVLDWLHSERQAWWLNEQAVGGSHAGFHLQAELLALAGAVKANDMPLRVALEIQVQRALQVSRLTATPQGLVACVGERQENSGSNLPHMSAVYRLAIGLPHRGQLANNPSVIKTDTYWLCARVATALKSKGLLPKPPLSSVLPAMRRKLTVALWPDGHSTCMAELGRASRTSAWSYVDHAKADATEGKEGITSDYSGVAPLPAPPTASRVKYIDSPVKWQEEV